MTDLHRNTSVLTRMALLPILAAAVVIGGHAPAQSAPSAQSGQSGQSGDIRTNATGGADTRTALRGSERFTVVRPTSDGGTRTIEVRMLDGQVHEATVDGTAVPSERLEVRDGLVRILDEEGNLVQELMGGAAFGQRSAPMAVVGLEGGRLLERMRVGGFPSVEVDAATFGLAAPRASLGIHLAEPDEALRSHLGLSPGGAVLVTQVIAGSAAEEAGLQVHDVIVAIDGRRPVAPSTLRDAVAEREPGTPMRVELIRRGAAREITVRLAAPDRRVSEVDRIAEILRNRVGGLDLNVEVLDEIDGRLRRLMLFVPGHEGDGEGDGGGDGAAIAPRARDVILQAIPDRDAIDRWMNALPRPVAPPDRGVADDRTEVRLRTIEATLDRLSRQLDAVLERLER